jgi:hypothetical protein
MITEQIITSLPEVKFIKTKNKEPQSSNKDLPNLFFSVLICGAKNSGKTYACVSLLKQFEQNPIYDHNGVELNQRIILFCPTAENNSNTVFKNLKYLDESDIYLEYSDDILEELLEEIKADLDEVKKYNDYIKLLYKFEKTNNVLTDEEYLELYYNDFEMVEPKIATVVHFIFDDLIGDTKFINKSRSSGFTKFLLRHRHYYTNIFLTSQYINSIPPIIKNNIDIFCIFKYANINDVITKFYDIVSGIMLEQDFIQFYKYATETANSFLTIINKGSLQIRKMWSIKLQLS